MGERRSKLNIKLKINAYFCIQGFVDFLRGDGFGGIMDVSSLKIDKPFVNMIISINFQIYMQFRPSLTLSDEKK